MTDVLNTPVYCSDCKSRNSWVRKPENDICGENGKVLFIRYRCKKCGKETIHPA